MTQAQATKTLIALSVAIRGEESLDWAIGYVNMNWWLVSDDLQKAYRTLV